MTFINDKKPKDCVYCKAYNVHKDDENYIIYRGKNVFVMLNRYPYSTGHLLIIPYRHVDATEHLSDDEMYELSLSTRDMISILKKTFSPDGFNIGMNLGHEAGAGITDHIHLHIVPRWGGDTNFMTVVARTKVHPTDLEGVYKLLKEHQ